MSIHDLLPLYAVGALEDDEAREVERALAVDPTLLRLLATYQDAVAELASALPGVAPSSSLRAPILAATESRFEQFVHRFGALFDVATARARELLALVDQPSAWEAGPATGSWLIHFPAGPALAGADTGFVRLAPGARFAWHRHVGRERSLVLHGRARDTLLGVVGPGDERDANPDSAHEFETVGADDFIFAVAAFGVDFTVPRPT